MYERTERAVMFDADVRCEMDVIMMNDVWKDEGVRRTG
jgi:hypothetical protein